jgi:hypothetical protein
MVVASCTPEQEAALIAAGVDPAVVADAAANPPIQVALPPARPMPTTTSVAPPITTPPKHTQPSDEKLYQLRVCESSDNYAAVSAGGTYRGAYQFNQSTWNGVASRHYPHLVGVDPATASPADQDAMARALYSERGAQPWPHCGRYLL